MSIELERRLDGMDRWRDALLRRLSAERPARLEARPAGASWCALDVVQHLVLVEEVVLGYARKKLQAPPSPVPLSARVKLVLLVLILKSPMRFRAPASVVAPAGEVPLPDLSARWKDVRSALRETMTGLPRERRTRLFFRHPISGPLDAAGTLTFLDHHARHHRAQIERVLRTASGLT